MRDVLDENKNYNVIKKKLQHKIDQNMMIMRGVVKEEDIDELEEKKLKEAEERKKKELPH